MKEGEFVADSKDRGLDLRFDVGPPESRAGTTSEATIGPLSELSKTVFSFGVLPLSISFNFTGSSFKSTTFFGASTFSGDRPDTARDRGATNDVLRGTNGEGELDLDAEREWRDK